MQEDDRNALPRVVDREPRHASYSKAMTVIDVTDATFEQEVVERSKELPVAPGHSGAVAT